MESTRRQSKKRDAIRAMEQRHRVGVLLIPNQTLDTPHFKLSRLSGGSHHRALPIFLSRSSSCSHCDRLTM